MTEAAPQATPEIPPAEQESPELRAASLIRDLPFGGHTYHVDLASMLDAELWEAWVEIFAHPSSPMAAVQFVKRALTPGDWALLKSRHRDATGRVSLPVVYEFASALVSAFPTWTSSAGS